VIIGWSPTGAGRANNSEVDYDQRDRVRGITDRLAQSVYPYARSVNIAFSLTVTDAYGHTVPITARFRQPPADARQGGGDRIR